MVLTNPRRSRYVGILALTAALILIGGWLVRPREVPQSPAHMPSETELEQLTRRAERRALDSRATFFAGVARDVAASVARVRIAQATGIVWDETRIITSAIPARPTRAAGSAAAVYDVEEQPVIWGPNLPFAAVRFDRQAGLTPAPRATSVPRSGDWLVAVWRTDSSPAFAEGNFRQMSSTTCGVTAVDEILSNVVFAPAMIGGGVFNLDGQLVGSVLPCDGRIIAMSVVSIQRLVESADTIDQRILGLLGLELAPLTPDEQEYFKTTDGLLVREVWSGGLGDRAGVRPGDVVIAVDRVDIRTISDMAGMASAADAPLEMTFVRDSKRLTIALAGTGAAAPPAGGSAGSGVTLESSRPSYRIASVQPESAAARAGVQAGDRLIGINQTEPRSAEQVNRILTARKQSPMWLEVERRGRRLGLLLR